MKDSETKAIPPLEIMREFSADLYLEANPDVAAAGMDAVEHYLQFGRMEGRAIRPKDEASLKSAIEKGGKAFEVFADIHPEDHLFAFFRAHAKTDDEAVDMYFSQGRDSAMMFAELVAKYRATVVLEFASGYGRMTRHVKHVAPHVDLTVCDIHPQANRFVSENMDVRAIESSPIPEDYKSDREYDLTFALSLFSHLPEVTWTRWLKALIGTVRVGGFVAFTTHGLVTTKQQGIELNDFLFRDISEQADIDLAQYGTAYVTYAYALKQINSLGAHLVDFREGYWFGHQDLYVIQRMS